MLNQVLFTGSISIVSQSSTLLCILTWPNFVCVCVCFYMTCNNKKIIPSLVYIVAVSLSAMCEGFSYGDKHRN